MTEGGRSFAVTTCQLWNSLSLELRNSVSLESFKNNYRNNLFDVQQILHHFIVNIWFIICSQSYVLFLFIIRLIVRWIFLVLLIVMLEFHIQSTPVPSREIEKGSSYRG